MLSETFITPLSSEFWQRCKVEMPQPYLEVVNEILQLLDTEGGMSSVKSRFPSPSEDKLQGQVSLLEHSISVATICRDSPNGEMVRHLAIIAGLAHDCGKLPLLHRGPYVAAMHGYWSAVYLAELVRGHLNQRQEAEVIDAVRYHHEVGGLPVQKVLQAADRRARVEAVQVVADRLLRQAGGTI